MGPSRTLIARWPLATFLIGSIGLGWILTVVSAQLASNPILLPLIAIPVSYVPALMAWVVLRTTGTPEERRAWRQRLTRVRVGWRWYALGLVALPLVHLAGVGLATLLGGAFPFHPLLLTLFPLFLLTNFGEEIGWRGYALPKLQERMTPLPSALVLGVVWGAFHWVALAGNADAPLAYMAISTAHLVAISVLMTFVFNGSGQSVPAVAVVHAMYDTVAIAVAPLIETTVPLLAFSLTAVVAWIAVAVLVARTGSDLGRDRSAMRADATDASTPAARLTVTERGA
jgi:membrane protease YdiL (CAAX protease family)